MSDTLALWVLFGLLSIAFVAMQFAFRPKPSILPGILFVPSEFIESVRLITGEDAAWSFVDGGAG